MKRCITFVLTTGLALATVIGTAAYGSTYKLIYTFQGEGKNDGASPSAGLIQFGGVLYGTTEFGGARDSGTVFSITADGTEKVLHSFTNSPDGALPLSKLVVVGGRLYGTTYRGGSSRRGLGTVFQITPGGNEKVLYSFIEAVGPMAGLTKVHGSALRGTTSLGGGQYNGTIFRINREGQYGKLYSFRGLPVRDGSEPYASLVEADGTLYGTTYQGGVFNSGTVFTVADDGKATVLYSFEGGGDGANPAGKLVEVNGLLYGTTEKGGANNHGTVFTVTPNGVEAVLHSFGYGNGEGYSPEAGLIFAEGALYGTTVYGGTAGAGTIFRITPGGDEGVVYDFAGYNGYPYAELLDVDGTFFGTTRGSGGYDFGTVFSFQP